MTRLLERPLVPVIILLALSFYLFFFRLGGMALTDPDEAFYAQTAKEMLALGEWHTPYLFGKPQFEKPVLFYWLVEASFKFFGINEFSARLPSAVMGVIGVVAMYCLGTTLFGRRAGFFAGFILATNIEYIVLARACVTDMTLTVFLLFGILFFFYGHKRSSRAGYLLSSAAFALAMLTKGPIAFIFPAVAIVTTFLIRRDLKSLTKIPILECALVFAAVALPWYVVMYRIHGWEFIGEFFGFRNINRFLVAEHKIGSQWYYNIPIMMGGFFPWSAFLPVGLWYAFRKRMAFALIWLAVVFFFFTASSTKLPTYIFPCFISLALITGALWDDFLKGLNVRQVTISFYALMAAVVVGAIAAMVYIYIDYPMILAGAGICAAVLALGMMASLYAFLDGKKLASFILVGCAVALFVFPLDSTVLPIVERYEASKEVSGELKKLMAPGEKVGSESNYLAGIAFYTDIFPRDLDPHHELVNFLESPERVWCVIKEKNHRFLYELDTTPKIRVPSYMLYRVGKRSIVTNERPKDGKYLIKRERED